jgi:hypothetical protein
VRGRSHPVALASIGTVLIFTAVRAVFGVRPTVRDEIGGLDLAEHGEEAYLGGDLGGLAGPGFAIGEGVVLSGPPTASPPRAA